MKTNPQDTLDPVEKAGLPTGRYPGGFRIGKGSGRRRILGPQGRANAYHVMSRTAGGEMLFGEVEKEAFTRVMRRLERFAGVEILTHAVMANHFHLLVRVPDREKFLRRFEGPGGEERLLEHLKLLYSKTFLTSLRAELADLRKKGLHQPAEDLLERFRKRFCNLEIFVKELKERFSRWFNKHHGRRGTLWMERYKSVIVQDGEALRTMAAYIDLNPVRAGLCDDPKDYRWCGYAEAVAGSKRARRGLCRVLERPLDSWEEKPAESGLTASEWYRCWLFGEGLAVADGSGKTKRRGMSLEAVRKVRESGGKLSRAQLLRCRVRYFSDGVAIGGRGFIEELFGLRRECFGPKRKDGARPIREAETGLFSLRALRVRAVESEDPLGMPMGRVNFGGIVKEVCMAYVPDVKVGEYVVVHVGFAISKVDEEEAATRGTTSPSMDELGELDIPQPE
jgi:putative transposase